MKKTTHTPGPWFRRGMKVAATLRHTPKDGSEPYTYPTFLLQSANGQSRSNEERIADLNLAAAAPTMLAELRRDLEAFTNVRAMLVAIGQIETVQFWTIESRIDMIKAAIEAAERGRP